MASCNPLVSSRGRTASCKLQVTFKPGAGIGNGNRSKGKCSGKFGPLNRFS
ncbi:hypothetical protein [Brevibacillus parabrevis]|uniref:hypothetical protein n=1 Tax=Brevibacillus parabrevis TaxID=54914 RepID=UPI0028D4CF80|nr:hypothetical protein [Brevibacillus parabrevis]